MDCAGIMYGIGEHCDVLPGGTSQALPLSVTEDSSTLCQVIRSSDVSR